MPFFVCIESFSQSAMGLLFDDEAYQAVPVQSLYRDGGKSEKDVLRNITKVDLKPYCPLPQDQDTVPSCVGWATGYGAFTIETAIQNNWKNQQERITRNAYSAMFLYNHIRTPDSNCKSGSQIPKALQWLQENGDVLSSHFDHHKHNCQATPDSSHFKFARSHIIKDYLRLFDTDDDTERKVYKTKLSLVQNKPVIIGMEILHNFLDIATDDKYWHAGLGDTSSTQSGHAMVVVGFDDGRQAFELMNSWGPYWANKGFIWVRYKDFGKYCKYGFQMSLFKSKEKKYLYEGQLALHYPDDVASRSLKEVSPRFNGQYYELENKWASGSKFQITASKTTAGLYLYVFSIDPNGQVKIHFPRSQESAQISAKTVKLKIPGPTKSLQFKKVGADYVCALYSSQPIQRFRHKIEKIKWSGKGDVFSELRKVFGACLADGAYFRPGKMQLSVVLTEGEVIPLILRVDIEPF